MYSDVASLEPVYRVIRDAPNLDQLLRLSGRQAPGRTYTRKCDEITARLPETQGFYLWGCYDAKGLWKNIYLGKAGLGKAANLKKRIREELKDERCFAWRPFCTKQELLEVGEKIHSNMWRKYKRYWERALLKQATTHIVWVSTPTVSNKDVLRIEADLIESLNPSANIRRPAPPKDLQGDTRDVFGLFRQKIHEERGNRFRIQVVDGA